MGNRSYVTLSNHKALTELMLSDRTITYEYNNGIALLWPLMFHAKDIGMIEFDIDNGERNKFPILQADSKNVIARLNSASGEVINRYGKNVERALSQFFKDIETTKCSHVILNPIEYYMFGFGDMTDLDVAITLAQASLNIDWEHIEQLSGYESIKDDHDTYPFIGERY